MLNKEPKMLNKDPKMLNKDPKMLNKDPKMLNKISKMWGWGFPKSNFAWLKRLWIWLIGSRECDCAN